MAAALAARGADTVQRAGRQRGNLLVSGEKMVAINQGNEFIRFSGVINPNNVTAANTVQSTQVADARIEYRGSGFIDESNTMGWLQRFFVAIMPF